MDKSLPHAIVPHPSSQRLAYSTQEVAKMLGLSVFTVYRLIQRGKLHATSALRHKLIPASSIRKFIEEEAR